VSLAGPCRISGGFGTGKTTALRARAEALADAGQRPLVLHHRDLGGFSVEVLRRHGRPTVELLDDDEHVELVAELLDGAAPTVAGLGLSAASADERRDDLGLTAADLSGAVLAYEASFLGVEELLVHADAAGQLERWEFLASFADRYLGVLASRDRVDRAGAVVQASLALRDPAVLAAEQARFDHLLVDDYQLATFATSRLLAQLAGPGGNLTVAGHPEAAIGSDFSSRPVHFERFAARFGGATEVALDTPHRSPAPPTLRLADGPDDERGAIFEALDRGLDLGLSDADVVVFSSAAAVAQDAVGREWALVVVAGLGEDRWPRPRPTDGVFDLHLLGGPDVPDPAERDRQWLELERRRFAVATSRAAQWLVLVAEPPVSPFVGDLVRASA
jgi:superfamily I DNA/RNA helicase